MYYEYQVMSFTCAYFQADNMAGTVPLLAEEE
jgi:hypothetical protein